MINGKGINQLMIEVEEDYQRGIYLLRVSKEFMPDFQRAIIEGASKDNTVVFFNLKDKRIRKNNGQT